MTRIACDIVFLDAGMTLIHPMPEFHEGILHVLNENGHPFKLEDIKQHARAAINNLITQIMGGRRYAVSDEADREFWADVYEGLMRDLGLDGDARDVGVSIYDFYRQEHSFDLFEDTLPALQSLRARGFRLGVISNFSTILEDVFIHRGIRDYFDPFIVSAAENCMKPDVAIYELALRRAGADPARAVMVGDNPMDDVHGAQAAGVTPILIDRFDRVSEPVPTRIKSLLELVDILESGHPA